MWKEQNLSWQVATSRSTRVQSREKNPFSSLKQVMEAKRRNVEGLSHKLMHNHIIYNA